MQAPEARHDAAAILAVFFLSNGHVRMQNAERAAAEGWGRYKKGYEVRLVAESARELKLVRRLLRMAGFKPGRPFVQGRQFRQPIYGREAVTRFLNLIGTEAGVGAPDGPRSSMRTRRAPRARKRGEAAT